MTDINTIWSLVLDIVRDELNTPSFKTWFEHTAPVELTDDGVFVVGVQNEFARNWLEERYSQRLSSALKQVVGVELAVRILVDQNSSQEEEADEDQRVEEPVVQQAPSAPDKKNTRHEFDPKYTFDSFVVGESNDFARNVALAVAEQPGLKYNPLFLWGGPGLGKTHLLQAIGIYVTQNFPHKKVIYVTSEQFTNDYVDSITAKSHDSFRQKYRSVDVLLIDDIQFLENKQSIQEQFFNTFNELKHRGKAVVLASDRRPQDINMEERYRSRFASGLQADIQPPTYETRLAILKQFVETQNIPFEDAALAYVAERSTPNIREMEGAVIRIIAYRELSKKQIVDLPMVEQVTKDIFLDRSHRPIPITSIQREVCRYYSISHAELIGSKRSQSIVYPRQVAMYLARELTDMSLPKIGNEFGGRDHTTVMHAFAKIQKLMSQRDVYNQIQQITSSIRQKA
ncbi:MAG: chromosomal replication initiator protein DnaA [Actinobacteria bacterium HGW-Actinobacteria-7]|nr:MAG: chromosomal replication initiator protein DnaA [Actinobacteria bacterium HGW-Actinobacteria-7]